MSISLALTIVAIVCFILAALSVAVAGVSGIAMVGLGLAFFAAAHITL